jgi:hypothetical protein
VFLELLTITPINNKININEISKYVGIYGHLITYL